MAKKIKFHARAKSATLAIFQKSADWLDWPCPVSAALQTAIKIFFSLLYFNFTLFFLHMKPLSEVAPGFWSFRSRSKQCAQFQKAHSYPKAPLVKLELHV